MDLEDRVHGVGAMVQRDGVTLGDRTVARDRTVDEWKLRATRPDNHWLDCLVGCAVAASIQGASLPGVADGPARPRQRIRLSELQRGR